MLSFFRYKQNKNGNANQIFRFDAYIRALYNKSLVKYEKDEESKNCSTIFLILDIYDIMTIMSVLQISMQIIALVTIDIRIIKRKERNYTKKDKKETLQRSLILLAQVFYQISMYIESILEIFFTRQTNTRNDTVMSNHSDNIGFFSFRH